MTHVTHSKIATVPVKLLINAPGIYQYNFSIFPALLGDPAFI
jgi:hypothetical protein